MIETSSPSSICRLMLSSAVVSTRSVRYSLLTCSRPDHDGSSPIGDSPGRGEGSRSCRRGSLPPPRAGRPGPRRARAPDRPKRTARRTARPLSAGSTTKTGARPPGRRRRSCPCGRAGRRGGTAVTTRTSTRRLLRSLAWSASSRLDGEADGAVLDRGMDARPAGRSSTSPSTMTRAGRPAARPGGVDVGNGRLDAEGVEVGDAGDDLAALHGGALLGQHPGEDAGAVRAGGGELELAARLDELLAQGGEVEVQPGELRPGGAPLPLDGLARAGRARSPPSSPRPPRPAGSPRRPARRRAACGSARPGIPGPRRRGGRSRCGRAGRRGSSPGSTGAAPARWPSSRAGPPAARGPAGRPRCRGGGSPPRRAPSRRAA